MNTPAGETKTAYMIGMFAAGFTLMCAQIALTRLMAAAIGTHATFAILGVVMLGLAASGTRLFLHRKNGKTLAAHQALERGAFALIGSLAVFLVLTAIPAIGKQQSLAILCGGVFVFPFFYIGYFITLVLEEHSEFASRLYASDLFGAACGAVGAVVVLDLFSPQVAFIFLAVVTMAAAVALDRSKRSFGVLAFLFTVFLLAFSFPSTTRLRYASTTHADELRWEMWDHQGHVSVLDYPEGLRELVEDENVFELSHIESADKRADFVSLGWAMSRNYSGPIPKAKYIRIDAGVGTPIVEQDPSKRGDVLKWDVTAAGFAAVERVDDAGIVGTGGGRDILTALDYGASNVNAFEINPKVHLAVEGPFRELSGGPYSLPGVTAKIGEARSLIRGTGPYDVVELPMTDTYSASSSGTLVFSENGLYTVEAFRLFLAELKPGGVLSVSRFFSPTMPGEITRILATARDAVPEGNDPEKHVVVVYAKALISNDSGIANVLVKREPFTEADLKRLEVFSKERGFEILYPSPEIKMGYDVSALLKGDPEFAENTFIDMSPIVDDRPFFYDNVRPIASTIEAFRTGDLSLMSLSVRTLILFLLIVLFASKVLIIDPIRRAESDAEISYGHWTTLFFAAIGFGFLGVELAVIQRCTLYLGHPTYSLTVVLASLLIASSVGSALSARIATEKLPVLGFLVVGTVLVSAFVQPLVLGATETASFGARVGVAVALIAPLGVVMGMLYPTAIRLLSKRDQTEVIPWCWAVNGTSGVIATTVGMFIAMRIGYTALFVIGGLTYALAGWAAIRALKQQA